jgi:hypothetical protein
VVDIKKIKVRLSGDFGALWGESCTAAFFRYITDLDFTNILDYKADVVAVAKSDQFTVVNVRCADYLALWIKGLDDKLTVGRIELYGTVNAINSRDLEGIRISWAPGCSNRSDNNVGADTITRSGVGAN